jgi:hypothetical protein
MLFEVDRPGPVRAEISGHTFKDPPSINQRSFDIQGDSGALDHIKRPVKAKGRTINLNAQ